MQPDVTGPWIFPFASRVPIYSFFFPSFFFPLFFSLHENCGYSLVTSGYVFQASSLPSVTLYERKSKQEIMEKSGETAMIFININNLESFQFYYFIRNLNVII